MHIIMQISRSKATAASLGQSISHSPPALIARMMSLSSAWTLARRGREIHSWVSNGLPVAWTPLLSRLHLQTNTPAGCQKCEASAMYGVRRNPATSVDFSRRLLAVYAARSATYSNRCVAIIAPIRFMTTPLHSMTIASVTGRIQSVTRDVTTVTRWSTSQTKITTITLSTGHASLGKMWCCFCPTKGRVLMTCRCWDVILTDSTYPWYMGQT